ncbi:MAG: VOC family protein [Minwuia sp.]|uniref:VOC family protein n=1 Tax=Minwuia sp. TaxID=2493630 RepID=UPI003A889FB8
MTEIEPPRIFVSRRYRDTKKMIAWLEEAFGFETHFVVEGEDGSVMHSQLSFGSSMIMLGDDREDDHAGTVGRPDGAAGGQSIYIAIDDADAAYARAKAAGATFFRELMDTDYGSRDFGCYDPEGQAWNFGTYWPKAHEAPEHG